MDDFQLGPFRFCRLGTALSRDSRRMQVWGMYYGDTMLDKQTIRSSARTPVILEVFEPTRLSFIGQRKAAFRSESPEYGWVAR